MKFGYTTKEVYKRDVFIEKKYNNEYSEFYLMKSLKLKGFEKRKKNKILKNNKYDIERSSISRTKKNIRDLALCNDFEYFYTQTFNNENRYDLDYCISLVKTRFKAYQRKYNNFKYLVIYEFHKDKAIHLHALLKCVANDDLKINEYGYLTFKFMENLGFNSLSKIRDNLKCANYICKYISKDLIKSSKNQRYFCSKGLDKPKKFLYSEYDLNDYILTYSNEFVKKYIKGALK